MGGGVVGLDGGGQIGGAYYIGVGVADLHEDDADAAGGDGFFDAGGDLGVELLDAVDTVGSDGYSAACGVYGYGGELGGLDGGGAIVVVGEADDVLEVGKLDAADDVDAIVHGWFSS